MIQHAQIVFFKFTSFKIFYFIERRLYVYSFILQKHVELFLPFQEITSVKYVNPYLFLTGSANRYFGFMVLDFSKQLPLNTYQIYIQPPAFELTFEEIKRNREKKEAEEEALIKQKILEEKNKIAEEESAKKKKIELEAHKHKHKGHH